MGEFKDKIIQKIQAIGKTIAKTLIKSYLPLIIIIVVAVILISAIISCITLDDATFKEGDLSNVGYVVSEIRLSQFNVDNIVKTNDGYKFDVDLDELVEEVIQTLEENEGVLDKYISLKNQKEYLKAFIKAEIITQYPDLRNASKIGTATKSGEVQGCIKIYRSLPDGTSELLTYVDYDTFCSYGEEATHHFTLDSSGNLIVAGWNRVTTNVESNIEGVENLDNEVEYSITQNPVNYKSAVSNYTMPFDFLWTLTVLSRDEDFAYEVANLALDSEITITAYDNLTTNVTDNLEEYYTQTKEDKEAWIFGTVYNTTIGDISSSTKASLSIENEPVYYYTHTNVKSETCSTTVQVTYADVWIAKYTQEYSNTVQDESTNEEVNTEDDTEYELIEEGTRTIDSDMATQASNYKENLTSRYTSYWSDTTYVSTSYGNVSYQLYSRTKDYKVTNKTTSSYNKYTQRNINSRRENRQNIKRR